VLLAAGCGNSRTYEGDAKTILREAKQAVDSASALHFSLESSDVHGGSGPMITGGQGDAKRPDGFAGSLHVSVGGLPLSVNIVSINGSFYASALGAPYSKADPSKYGFADPSKLIDPNVGLTNLLISAKSASLGDRDRLGNDELYEIDVSLPGDQVKSLLTSADPSQDVKGRVGVNVDNHQVRRVVLTGPFFDAKQLSTFTLVLDNYGENVTITPPAVSG
jgi:lipoprotein LprG